MKKPLLTLLIALLVKTSFAQNEHAVFPQAAINAQMQTAYKNYKPLPRAQNAKSISVISSPKSVIGVLNRIEELKRSGTSKLAGTAWVQIGDTIVVGATANDTLKITGYWTHNGPILVLGNGVLLVKNATLIDSGDVYVFQNGKILADSSSLTFPQQYFYQRSLIAVQNGTIQLQNCLLNYSGMSHNLVIGDSAHVTMNKVHQHDWTTCGLFSHPTLNINGCNLAGEYILTDSASATFKNTDTLLLWHQFPNTAVVNYAFPNGNAVYNYNFNNTVAGIAGIKYNVSADSCHDVMWAMMPVNGSNITISNSTLRAIGTWFQHSDTVNVSNLKDSSNYANFVAPLADRNLHLINTYVQTWSLYVFDKSHIDVDSCQVGEVGTQQRATVTQINPFLLDGTGGYFWATDTSAVISFGATVYSYVRSERNGIFILAYGWVPFSAPQAIGNSLMVYVQSYAAGDPVAYDAATAWMDKIDGPDTSYTNGVVPITGSAWIDWAANGTGWMDFKNYSVFYQLQGNTTWTRIVKDSLVEFHHATVADWNTLGLTPGNYLLKLTVKNNFGDSVEAIKPITLKPGVVGIAQVNAGQKQIAVYPNPNEGTFTISLNESENAEVEIYNLTGQRILTQNLQDQNTTIDLADFSNGIYQLRIVKGNSLIYTGRLVKQ